MRKAHAEVASLRRLLLGGAWFLSVLVAVLALLSLYSCDPLSITTPWCDPCTDTIYVDTLP